MLRTPLYLQPAPMGEFDRTRTYEVRDNAGRVVGAGFTAPEGSVAILRLNIHDELVAALQAFTRHSTFTELAEARAQARNVLAKAEAMC